jgi:predicted nucleic acid-binding protein
MTASPTRVLLDANVLFSQPLRDVLLAAAATGWVQPYWSAQILRETCRSLVRTGRASEGEAQSLREELQRAYPAALVTGHEALIPAMGNHPADRHVAAAAHHAGVPLIVTRNLHDFRKLPPVLKAVSPDALLLDLFERDPAAMEALLRRQPGAEGGLAGLLAELHKIVPRFAKRVRNAAPDA